MMGYLLRNRVLFLGSRINDEVRHAWQLHRRQLLVATVHSAKGCTCGMLRADLSDLPHHGALQVATQIVASLLALETLSDTEDIKMYINSPGARPPAAHPMPSSMCTCICPQRHTVPV